MHGPLQTDSLKHSNEYQRLIYGKNFDDFSKFPVCNDLRKLSRGFIWLFGGERNMQITLSQGA